MLVRQFVLISLKSRLRCTTAAAVATAGSRSSAFNFQMSHNFSTNQMCAPRICVIGAGPSGFYASQYILKMLSNAQIDIIEKLPVPFGLVRYGNCFSKNKYNLHYVLLISCCCCRRRFIFSAL